MIFSEVKYGNYKRYFDLEDWMIFAAELGEAIREESGTENINLYISLPNSILFSQFMMLGVFNYHFEEDITSNEIVNIVKKLEKGDVVYYLDNDDWKRCSVLGLTKGLINENSVHLTIKNNKNITEHIPQNKWETNVIISKENKEVLSQARTVKELKFFGNSVLGEFYSMNRLNKHQMINRPCVYLSGNRTEFELDTERITLLYGKNPFTFNDFYFGKKSNHFQNVEWINSDGEIDFKENKAPITFFMSASKALMNMDKCRQNTSRIFLDDRHENVETSEILRLKIEQEIVQNQTQVCTKEIYDYLVKKGVPIPKGVEFIVWK